MHHKRKRPKAARAGCLMCKPWKLQAYSRNRRLPLRDKRKLGLRKGWI